MKPETKLKLVTRGNPEGAWDDEPTAEEIAAADELRRALDAGEDPLASSLGAAWCPDVSRTGTDADLDAILNRALGDEAAVTSLEAKAGERLRVELDRDEAVSDGPSTQLARALRAASRPRAIDPALNDALLWRALGSKRVRRLAPAAISAVVTMAALAAGLALFIGRTGAPTSTHAPVASLELARTRSTEDLFDATTPFPRTGQESARVDRIAAARAADLRNNRFAAWGVR